jgi:phosphoribosylformylglycinamidine (FGAM) synthase-like amidotransferase family enzyme
VDGDSHTRGRARARHFLTLSPLPLTLARSQFYARPDTWSLGICNGCQLMALLGWVPATGGEEGGMRSLTAEGHSSREELL